MSNNGGFMKRKAPDQVTGDSNHVSLSIKGQDGRQLFFKVNRDSQFSKIFKEYYKRMNLENGTLRFLYDGHRVNGRQTPQSIDLEDKDEILAVGDVLGGGVAALTFYQHVMDR